MWQKECSDPFDVSVSSTALCRSGLYMYCTYTCTVCTCMYMYVCYIMQCFFGTLQLRKAFQGRVELFWQTQYGNFVYNYTSFCSGRIGHGIVHCSVSRNLALQEIGTCTCIYMYYKLIILASSSILCSSGDTQNCRYSVHTGN